MVWQFGFGKETFFLDFSQKKRRRRSFVLCRCKRDKERKEREKSKESFVTPKTEPALVLVLAPTRTSLVLSSFLQSIHLCPLSRFVSQHSISLFDPPFILPSTPPPRRSQPIINRLAGIHGMLVSDLRLRTLTLALSDCHSNRIRPVPPFETIFHDGVFSIHLVYIHLIHINLFPFPSNCSIFCLSAPLIKMSDWLFPKTELLPLL